MNTISANSAAEPQFAKTQSLCAHWDRLHNTIRELFPVKTSAYLAEATGLSQRAAEMNLREKRGLSSDALVALLDTDHGYDVLKALMGDSRRKWWKTLKRAAEREQMKSEIAELQKRIDALSVPE
jgi:hypothetical protein